MDGGFIADGNGNESVVFQTTASAVNQLDITNGATGGAVILSATGDDTNVDMTLTPQGSGEVNIAAGNLNYAGTAVTSTGAELNIMDGGTSATGTTVADADRVVLNDGGTMVQAAGNRFRYVCIGNNKDFNKQNINGSKVCGWWIYCRWKW